MIKNKKVGYAVGIGAIVVAAVLGWTFYGSSKNNANFPEGTLWVCMDPACRHEFAMSVKELGQYEKEHWGEPMKCQKCGKTAFRADRCQHCGKAYPQQQRSSICPHCRKENTPPAE
jgi:hypothetical protein